MVDQVFCTESWISKVARKEADRDRLRLSERLGELFAVLIISLIGIYFISLQVNDTGFFTSSFSNFDVVPFYGALFYGVVPSLARAIWGRRNRIRPFEIIGNGLFIISGSYFLTHWSFDFSNFSHGLPHSLQSILSWVTDAIAQDLLLLAVVITFFVAAWTSAQYYFVRGELQARERAKAGDKPSYPQ